MSYLPKPEGGYMLVERFLPYSWRCSTSRPTSHTNRLRPWEEFFFWFIRDHHNCSTLSFPSNGRKIQCLDAGWRWIAECYTSRKVNTLIIKSLLIYYFASIFRRVIFVKMVHVHVLDVSNLQNCRHESL